METINGVTYFEYLKNFMSPKRAARKTMSGKRCNSNSDLTDKQRACRKRKNKMSYRSRRVNRLRGGG